MSNKSTIKFKNPVTAICRDKDGNVKWEETNYNLMTNEGLNYVLDVVFSDGTQDATHYVGLTTAAVVAGDTLATGLDEFTSYTGDRKAWTEAGVSSQSITNSASPAEFAISGSGTVVGAFLTDAESGTSGTLVCGVSFTGSRAVESGDTVSVTYTLSAADA
jgi:hypothetical protein